jgi:uncharacterized membrane protein YcaP (DUF421 family)
METIHNLIGKNDDLTALQMSVRGVSVFILAFLLIRISGRRSFGMKGPVDNIIAILLGAILSRAVVGASPFVPVMVTSLVIVLLHRMWGWLISSYPKLGKFAEGEKILLYDHGEFLEVKMKRALICRAEIMQQIRSIVHQEDLTPIERIFMERDGKLSIILKPND